MGYRYQEPEGGLLLDLINIKIIKKWDAGKK